MKKLPPSDQRQIPLDLIDPWQEQPRIRRDAQRLKEMKASILAKGVLQNLLVVPSGTDAGRFVCIAGATRREALAELAAESRIATDAPVPCDVKDIDLNDPEAIELALAENITRGQMDEIDECVAMAKLVQQGRTIEHIAAVFGYRKKLVKERLALGRLTPEAQELVRDGRRDLDWARAMTLADQAMQGKICTDIGLNPVSWKDGAEVRRYLTAETIPAEHALFDLSTYRGPLLHDMFDGDKIVDRAEFWELQNAAIEARKAEIAATGVAAVEVSHQPIDLWRFRRAAEPTEGKTIIEVSPNGRVVVHQGLIPTEPEAGAETEIEEIETVDAESDAAALHGDAIRLTPTVAEYVAAQRTAMIQAALAANPRACLEIVVAGLIGHGEIPIRAQDYRYPGHPDNRVGAAFGKVATIREDIETTLAGAGIPPTGRDDAETLAAVGALSDETLNGLFVRLLAVKVGQVATKRLDAKEGSLANTLGRALSVDVRAEWTPDEAFFGLMGAADLRRLAVELLPKDRRSGVLTAKKPHLVKMLADAFGDARDRDGSMDARDAERLNAWTPGPLRFPATDDAERAVAGAADPFSALFPGQDGEATGEEAFDALFSGEDGEAEAA